MEIDPAAKGTPFATLRRLARETARVAEEHCDMCSEPIGPVHRHLLDLSARQVLCACRACTILFDRAAAGDGRRRLIPTRYLYLPDFSMGDGEWDSLRVPVNMAFFVHNSAASKVMAFYPGPMGPTESHLALDTWEDLERRNPVLRELEPDVEALLVNRIRQTREYFLIPIDECFRLVGLIRTSWKGFAGGRDVWEQIDTFFANLKNRANVVGGPRA